MDHGTANVPLVSDNGLRGLLIIARELPVIDLHELARLNFCSRFGDTWAWVAPRPERQQAAPVGTPRAAEDAPVADEGAQAVPAPVQAPQPPPPAPQHRTMSQRIERLEEEVREMWQSVVGLRGVIESSITEQTRVSTWMISCMMQLMDASGHTYQAFDSTLVGSSRLPYQRRVRPKTGDASTYTAPHTNDLKGVAKGSLVNECFADWAHLTTRLKEHEVGLEHVTNMATWFDMRRRLKKNEAIDKERYHWMKVLLRITSFVKFLAKHNLAFSSSAEKLHVDSNGNFLGLIEMLEEFDPFIKEHTRIRPSQGLFDVTTRDATKMSLDLDIDDAWSRLYFKLLTLISSKSLATNEVGDFEFLVSTVIWFDILSVANLVSKKLQSDNMLIDVAVKEVEKLIAFFEEFRDTSFDKAINVAKEIAIEMDIDPVFRQKRVIRRKRQFDENFMDEETTYFRRSRIFKREAHTDNRLLESVDYEDLINNFASKNARRIALFKK
ncbi:zinc finger MYM-type protein 1-like protein [Tanacetum coccineum]